jgi:hypothetical protein
MLKRLAALAALGVSAISANAAVVFQFSFNNVAGTLAGTIHGEITLDFLSSGSASGIGSASEVRITSAPAGIPVAVEGSNLASWLTQVQNRFEVLNGVIVDYEFGASEGSPSTVADNVFCLNNGPAFFFPLGSAYFCGVNENYYGDGRAYVYNTGGIRAVNFAQLSTPVPEPGTATLTLAALGACFALARRRRSRSAA